MLTTAVTRSCSGGVEIGYAPSVIWMTSYLHIMGICIAEVQVGTASQPRRLGLTAVAESARRALFMIRGSVPFSQSLRRAYGHEL